MLIFSKLHDGREEGLGKQLDANNCISLVYRFPTVGRARNLTIVDQLQLGDNVKTNFREFILEHLDEHGKKMADSLVFAQDWRKATDLSAQSSTYMLIGVCDQFLYARHDLMKQGIAIHEAAESCPS